MTPFERWSVWATSVATTATGLIYLWMKYFLRPTESWAVVNHPWQPWVLKAHILVAPLLVFAVGLIATRHVLRHLRADTHRGRRTGIATALVLGPMVLTGYLLQTSSTESWLRVLALVHIVTGVLYAVGLALHQAAIFGRPRGLRNGGLVGEGVDARPPAARAPMASPFRVRRPVQTNGPGDG